MKVVLRRPGEPGYADDTRTERRLKEWKEN